MLAEAKDHTMSTSIGEGASYEAQQAIKKLGSNNILIRSVKPPEETRVTTGGRSFAIEYGLIFGLYPASRAAALNPIEALRHE